MRCNPNKIVCFLLLIFCSLFLYSAKAFTTEDSIPIQKRGISESAWKKIIQDKDFYYKNETESPLITNKKISNADNFLWKILQLIFSKNGRIILWIIFFVIIAFVLFKILSGKKNFLFSRRKKTFSQNADVIEKDILEIDWEEKLQDAVNKTAFKDAVRAGYMLLLQMLQEKQLIQYRIDKTNYDYAAELQSTNYNQTFRRLTQQYEFTWYGQYPVSEKMFQNFNAQLHELKGKLNS